MAVSLTHTTVATGTDAGNAQIGKTQWNETHTLTMATDRLLGRTTAGSGAVEEITASTGLTLTAGALAVAKAFPTGDIVGTTDTQNLSNKTFTDNPTFSAGTANGVLYLNGSNVLTSGSDLSFDGTALSVIGSAVTPLQVYRYAATGGVIIGQYTASGTSSAPTAVANGRNIGRNNFSGYDGTSFINAAQINAFVDGAVSTGVVYGKIGFNTRGADGLVERAYINSSGNVNIASLTASKAVFSDASKNLTSTGTLGVDQGGTGQTSYTDGQLLIGNSTGNTLTKATLTAGSGISITNGSGAITIASTGSMVYPGAGIAVSTGSAWGTSKTSPTGDIVGTSDTQTLTNKTLTDPTIVGAIIEDVFTITDGASVDINPGNGTIQLWTLGANRTPTATNFVAGESVTLMILDGTAYTVTWTTIGVTWVGGTAPSLDTTKYTVIELWKVSTTVYGALVGYA